MASLLFCMLTTIIVGIVFKLYPRYGINTLQAIVVNYFVCVIMASLVLGEFAIEAEVVEKDWFPYAILLGFIFISGFNLIAYSVQKIGITITTIMQKMSIVLTVPVAVWMYNESMSAWKISGLLLGLVAIYLTNKKDKDEVAVPVSNWLLAVPVIVLLMAVAIETGLQYVQETFLEGKGGLKFTATLFGCAGSTGLILVIFGLITGRLKFSYKNILAGIVLGIPNFFSIYLIIVAIKEGWEGSVFFPINNVSVLALSALIGFWFFNEKLSKANVIGLILAVVSIGLIARGGLL